ncbi:hypothetical protein LPBF_05215 [Flavobacterium crassostreae]|uniref:DUF4271 domain-containing protein n=2 Tax=Flavobacterium crassostreae TaxID=1763534 RepID=A0A1B9E6D0_9FLAO|nr:hypothetical protein LPBF_05215 [Flavobacterium crassostreae]
MEQILQPRITENKDWVTLLFVLTFAVIAFAKSVNENRFRDFMNLLFSDKYAKVYRENSNQKSTFTIALFLAQLLSFSFFIQLALSIFGLASKTDWLLFIQISTFTTFFVLAKYLLEKIVATAFNIEDFVEHFNLQKVNYRTYIGLFLLPINILLFYYNQFSTKFVLITTVIVLALNTLTYIMAIKKYHTIIFSKLFYFILYLCTLEITPYFFIYYWFTKGSD